MARLRACDSCYKKKIQCSVRQAGTPCNWCQHHSLACTFTRAKQTRKPDKIGDSDIRKLFGRIEQLEKALARSASASHTEDASLFEPAILTDSGLEDDETQAVQHESQATHDTQYQDVASEPTISTSIEVYSSSPTVRPWRTLWSRIHMGQCWFYKGIAIFSDEGLEWVALKAGEDVSFCKFPLLWCWSGPTLLSLVPTCQAWTSPIALHNVPSRKVAEGVCQVFFNNPFSVLFPVLDPVLFEKTMDMAYESTDDSSSATPRLLARACVLAALAVASRFENPSVSQPLVDGDKCADQVQYLLQHISVSDCLEGLQTVLLLHRYQNFIGQWQKADTLHAIACQTVCILGGHIYQRHSPSNGYVTDAERQADHSRTLFWLCYMLDKDRSLRSGQPPLLVEDYCDLTFPKNLESLVPTTPELGRTLNWESANLLNVPAQLSLGKLKEKVCRLLYSAHAAKRSDGDHLLHIRQLDDELEKWRSSCPHILRPTLGKPSPQPPLGIGPSDPHNWLSLHLQLEYHYLMISIHSTVRRCRGNESEPHQVPQNLHNVLHSSSDISLEASRSTLWILKDSVTSMIVESSKHILFYPTIAAITLFANVLVHPADAETMQDLELLLSATDIMRDLTLHNPSFRELEYMQQMTGFVTELAHLGSCAVAEATTKQGITPV